MNSISGLQFAMPQSLLAAATPDVDPMVQQLSDAVTALRGALTGIRAQNLAFFQEHGWQGIGLLAGGTLLACILIAWIVSRLFAKDLSSFGQACTYLFVSWGMAAVLSVFTAIAALIAFGIVGSVPATAVIVGIGFLMILYFAGIWPWQRIFDLSFNKGVGAMFSVLALNGLAQFGAGYALQPMYQEALANHPIKAPEAQPETQRAPVATSVAAMPAANTAPAVPVAAAIPVAAPAPAITIIAMDASAPVKPEALRAEVRRLYAELSTMRAKLDVRNESAVREFNQKAAVYADLKRQADAAESIQENRAMLPASGVVPAAAPTGVPTT